MLITAIPATIPVAVHLAGVRIDTAGDGQLQLGDDLGGVDGDGQQPAGQRATVGDSLEAQSKVGIETASSRMARPHGAAAAIQYIQASAFGSSFRFRLWFRGLEVFNVPNGTLFGETAIHLSLSHAILQEGGWLMSTSSWAVSVGVIL